MERAGFVASIAGTGTAGAEWPAWDAQRQSVMVLDVPESGGSRVVERLRGEFCDFWDTVPDIWVPIN